MLNLIYLLKVCILLMYRRLTIGTKHGKMIKYLGGYVAVGWVATEIAFFTACHPFKGYWAVPPPDPQCTTLAHYAIVQACFNISADLMMIFIPLPMIASLQLPLKQKIMLGVIFSMGFFVVSSSPSLILDPITHIKSQITAAILTKVFNLSNVYDTAYMLWYTREASVAVYVANLPMIWPLLREWIPYLRTGLTRSNDSELPRYATGTNPRSGARSNSKHHSAMMHGFDDLETAVDHKSSSIDTGSERDSNAAITPVASTHPPAQPTATTVRITAANLEKEPVGEKLDFGFPSRPVSWSLDEESPPRARHVPIGLGAHSTTPSVNLGVIHAETTIEVESAIGENDGAEESAASFDTTTMASRPSVRIHGGNNEARRLQQHR
jgi:hypothetical protein